MLWWTRLTCPLVLAIRDGKVSCLKGKLSNHLISDIRQLLADAGVREGSLHRSGNQRVGFSASIPPHCHQQLRNLLTTE